jgi:hypothetical protein
MRLLRSCQQRILRCPPPPPSAAHPPASPSARSRSSASAPARRANPDPPFVRARCSELVERGVQDPKGISEIGFPRVDERQWVVGCLRWRGCRGRLDKIGGSVYDGKALKGLHNVVVYNVSRARARPRRARQRESLGTGEDTKHKRRMEFDELTQSDAEFLHDHVTMLQNAPPRICHELSTSTLLHNLVWRYSYAVVLQLSSRTAHTRTTKTMGSDYGGSTSFLLTR